VGRKGDNRRTVRRAVDLAAAGDWVGGPDSTTCRGSSSPLAHLPTPSSARTGGLTTIRAAVQPLVTARLARAALRTRWAHGPALPS